MSGAFLFYLLKYPDAPFFVALVMLFKTLLMIFLAFLKSFLSGFETFKSGFNDGMEDGTVTSLLDS